MEERFDFNIETAKAKNPSVMVVKHKDLSHRALGALAKDNTNGFDFIYIDGSHQAPDVMTDACASFNLLRVGGIMVFDDYLWDQKIPNLHRPKLAIDMFVNLFEQRLRIVTIGYQFIIQRTA